MIQRLRRSTIFIFATALLIVSPVTALAYGFNCTLDGKTIGNFQTIAAYSSRSVSYGTTCAAQNRTCIFGKLTGSYAYASCSVQPAANCSFNGQTVLNNQQVAAYNTSSVPFGQYCYVQPKTCINGVLNNPVAQYASCTVNPPASCNFNGQTIPSGSSVTAYAASTVNYGSNDFCQAQSQLCNNGVLMGSFSAPSCSGIVPVMGTVTPASQYKCTNRTVYSSTQIYDASFALQPETDIDCLNANNFYQLRAGSTSGQAIWNYSSLIRTYDPIPPTLAPSQCAYKLNAEAAVTIASDRLEISYCREYCVNASLANPAASVMCYFASTPVEGFSNGSGSNPQWVPTPAPIGWGEGGGGG